MTQRTRSRYTRWMYLRGLRLDAGFSRAELAAEMNVSYPHMCQVEQGAAPASDELLIKLARRFDVKPSELIATMPAVPPRRVYASEAA